MQNTNVYVNGHGWNSIRTVAFYMDINCNPAKLQFALKERIREEFTIASMSIEIKLSPERNSRYILVSWSDQTFEGITLTREVISVALFELEQNIKDAVIQKELLSILMD